ncbi:MAG: P63C domain-containing protein [Acidobacteria bacterium]|nr:P63C domain-containing protein [Acidobacteriota bacterium]
MVDESIAAKGGRARARALEPEKRAEIAREAALARWGSAIPKATHEGELIIAGTSIKCAVLETGKRMLTQETFLKSIGRSPRAKGGTGSSLRLVDGLPPFLAANNIKSFISDELAQSTTPILFRSVKGGRGFGYDAMLLPMVCEVYLKARDAKALLPGQEHIASTCDLLMRGLARVGIIALVDEATGYQDERAKHELSRILEAYIVEELRPWIKTFPDEFFRQIYRLQKWEYKPGHAKRTPYVGKLINKYVYEPLPPGVLEELRNRNPITLKGYRRHKHFQFLTADTGHPHLDRQLAAVTTIMRISDDKDEFEENFAKAFAKTYQHRLPLVVEVDAKRQKK